MHFTWSQAIFSKYDVFLSIKAVLILASSADPDEMQHFHLGLHCLPNTCSGVSSIQRVNMSIMCNICN